MSTKTNVFSKNPRKENKPSIKKVDDWVQNRGVKKTEATKRLTFDIPVSWHTQIKSECAQRGVKMVDEILPLLQKHFSLKDEM